MNMAAIALLMLGKTRRRALRGLMAGTALRRRCLASHLLRIHVLLVRERLDSELAHLRWKAYSSPLSINRRRVTYDAHLTRRICEILRVALHAGRVAGEYRRHTVILTLMTEGAVLCLGLMLCSHVVKGRCALDDLGFPHVERRRRGRLSRGRRPFGGFVGSGRAGALASQRADEKNRRHRNDCES